MSRFLLAFACFFRVLLGRPLPERVLPPPPLASVPAAPPLPPPAAVAAEAGRVATERGALLLLAMLQREGRLVDFLEEDIAGFADDQVGAAAREVHRGLRKAVRDHFAPAPILAEQEDAPVTVEPGFDRSAIRLTGRVAGEPPFRGVLRHHGWRASRIALPDVTAAGDPTVVAAAEVELR